MKKLSTLIIIIGLIILGVGTLPKDSMAQETGNQPYKIAVADIMILKRQKIVAFQLSKDLNTCYVKSIFQQ